MSPEIDPADWPADLQLLAEQLHREADSLAECYPAERPRLSDFPAGGPTPTGRNWLRWMLGSSIAAAVLLPLCWAGYQWQISPTPTGPGHYASGVAGAKIASPQPAIAERIAPEPMPFYPVGIGLPDRDQPTTPVLSAPEWEAVLDLTPAEKWEGVELSL